MKMFLAMSFLFFSYFTIAQRVSICLTELQKEDSVQLVSFQGETYFNFLDTIVVELKDVHAHSGVMLLKLKNGYLLCDFSNFYNEKEYGKLESFSFSKHENNKFTVGVATGSGKDYFFFPRFLTTVNLEIGSVKKRRKGKIDG